MNFLSYEAFKTNIHFSLNSYYHYHQKCLTSFSSLKDVKLKDEAPMSKPEWLRLLKNGAIKTELRASWGGAKAGLQPTETLGIKTESGCWPERMARPLLSLLEVPYLLNSGQLPQVAHLCCCSSFKLEGVSGHNLSCLRLLLYDLSG